MVKNLDFICVGSGKSGTTTIFHYLRHHPDVSLPAQKEVTFFSRESRYSAGWETYANTFFDGAPISSSWGVIHPQYMSFPIIPERIHALMPDVRLFALLRNPVDAAYSYYRMKARTGSERRSFAESVHDQLMPKALQRARQGGDDITALDTYIARREYGRILAAYLDLFPSNQILIQFTDDLKRDPQSVLDNICDFIGLKAGFTPPNLGKR